ncbi:hypothetical protein EDD27_6607 [Nonomuraea polychroma]|uniref:Uncharacterized protein n=1 Tax=Nonomuraea polychroma TaxID=46176 RepID=A0A438ME48_9ACTN|nr:hypothetical protein EDD27_6607 [Nonomuraea polychroma]
MLGESTTVSAALPPKAFKHYASEKNGTAPMSPAELENASRNGLHRPPLNGSDRVGTHGEVREATYLTDDMTRPLGGPRAR